MKVIRARHVFDGLDVLAAGTSVLVGERRIEAVLPPGSELPSGCELVDFPESTLLPGLIDAHVHLCGDGGPGALERVPDFSDDEMTAVIETSLRVQLASGVTTVRDLGDRRYATIDWRDQRADGDGLPTVLASGPPLTTPGGHCWNMGGEVAGIDALRAAVRDRAERGVDIVKIMASGGLTTPGTDVALTQFTVEELAAVVAEAHSLGLQVTAHAHALEAIRNVLDAGVDAIEHLTFLTEAGVEIDPAVVARLAESDVVVCPTLGAVPGIAPPPALLKLLQRTGMTMEDRVRWVAALHQAGVNLVAGSDGGISPGKPHGILREGLIQLVGGGVAPVEVLASATSYGAQVCGLADRTGRLATGLDADLLVVLGDPFARVEALRDVQAVYVQGRQVV